MITNTPTYARLQGGGPPFKEAHSMVYAHPGGGPRFNRAHSMVYGPNAI